MIIKVITEGHSGQERCLLFEASEDFAREEAHKILRETSGIFKDGRFSNWEKIVEKLEAKGLTRIEPMSFIIKDDTIRLLPKETYIALERNQ